MSIVGPTDSSKYYGRKRSGAQSVHEREQQGKTKLPLSPYGRESGSQDHLDLTDEAKHALVLIRQDFQEVFRDYPQFRSYFPESRQDQSVRGGLAMMAQARRFLNDPINQGRSQQQADFGAFYKKLQDLASQHGHALAQLQRDLRRDPAGLYTNAPQ